MAPCGTGASWMIYVSSWGEVGPRRRCYLKSRGRRYWQSGCVPACVGGRQRVVVVVGGAELAGPRQGSYCREYSPPYPRFAPREVQGVGGKPEQGGAGRAQTGELGHGARLPPPYLQSLTVDGPEKEEAGQKAGLHGVGEVLEPVALVDAGVASQDGGRRVEGGGGPPEVGPVSSRKGGLYCGGAGSAEAPGLGSEAVVGAEGRWKWGPSRCEWRPSAPEAGHVVPGADRAAAAANSKAGELGPADRARLMRPLRLRTPGAGHVVLEAGGAAAAANLKGKC